MKLSESPMEIDHFIGNLNAPVIIVEYGDYNCPHTLKVNDWVKILLKEFNSQFTFIYRHYPLFDIHPNSILAALASETAAKWNLFWQMHNWLIKNSGKISLSNITNIAKKFNINQKDFLEELESDETLYRVYQDYQSGKASGVTSTPAIFINGIKFEGVLSFENLRRCIIKALSRNQYLN